MRRKAYTLSDLASALNQAARYIRWEREVIEQFHSYSHEYGCAPGKNVFQFVLDDARRMRRLGRCKLCGEIMPDSGECRSEDR